MTSTRCRFLVMIFLTYVEQEDQSALLLGYNDRVLGAAANFPTTEFRPPYYLHFESLINGCNTWNIAAYALGVVGIIASCVISSYSQVRVAEKWSVSWQAGRPEIAVCLVPSLPVPCSLTALHVNCRSSIIDRYSRCIALSRNNLTRSPRMPCTSSASKPPLAHFCCVKLTWSVYTCIHIFQVPGGHGHKSFFV